MPDTAAPDWISAFPPLANLDDTARRTLAETARQIDVPEGTTVFAPGSPCEAYLLVRVGTVRVQMVSEGGREIVLYRVADGETCIMTTACLMAGHDYQAEGVAETDVRAVAVPAATFARLVGDSAAFRRFVFAAYGTRMTDLMLLVEEVAFGRIDRRLARLLADFAAEEPEIRATHHELAVELGTAREVVSRQLKEFKRRGWVRLGRGMVEVRDRNALVALAEADDV